MGSAVGAPAALALALGPSLPHPTSSAIALMSSSVPASGPATPTAAAPALKRVPVILLGCGNVGQALLTQIQLSAELHASRYGLEFSILALADSTGFMLAAPGADTHPALTHEQLTVARRLKEQRKPLSSHSLGSVGTAAQLVSGVTSRTRCIVVDASASEGMAPVLLQALERGSAAVTANKKPMTSSQALWDAMHAPALRPRLRYESTGTPMVAALARVISSGDSVRKVVGAFSGTLGSVMTALELGKSYSQAVGEAISLGFTEPDPRDDLGGVDVARKALILARMMGRRAEMSDVAIEPLYNARELSGVTVAEFLAALPTHDAPYAEKAARAQTDATVLRYVANIEEPQGALSVGLMAVQAHSPLGRLQGTANLLEMHTAVYGMAPLVVQGAGAGEAVTAVGCLSDMVEVAAFL